MGKKKRPSYQELYESKGDDRIAYLAEIIYPLLEKNLMMNAQEFEAFKDLMQSGELESDRIWIRLVDNYRYTQRSVIEEKRKGRKTPET